MIQYIQCFVCIVLQYIASTHAEQLPLKHDEVWIKKLVVAIQYFNYIIVNNKINNGKFMRYTIYTTAQSCDRSAASNHSKPLYSS